MIKLGPSLFGESRLRFAGSLFAFFCALSFTSLQMRCGWAGESPKESNQESVFEPALRGTPFVFNAYLGVSFLAQYSTTGFNAASPLFGGDLVYSIRDVLQLGPFFNYNRLSNLSGEGGGDLRFTGLYSRVRVARVEESNFFMDLRLGWTDCKVDHGPSASGLGYAVGALYFLPLSARQHIGVHLSYRNLQSHPRAAGSPLHSLDPSIFWGVAL